LFAAKERQRRTDRKRAKKDETRVFQDDLQNIKHPFELRPPFLSASLTDCDIFVVAHVSHLASTSIPMLKQMFHAKVLGKRVVSPEYFGASQSSAPSLKFKPLWKTPCTFRLGPEFKQRCPYTLRFLQLCGEFEGSRWRILSNAEEDGAADDQRTVHVKSNADLHGWVDKACNLDKVMPSGSKRF